MNHAELEERQLDLAVQPEDDGMVFLKPQWLQYFADDETTPENWNSFIEVLYDSHATPIADFWLKLFMKNLYEKDLEELSLEMFKPEVKKMKKRTELIYEISTQ